MRQSTRRHFLKSAVATAFAAPVFIRNLRAAAPNEVVRHASFGAGGMAAADLSQITKHPNVKLVCVADVDLDRAEKLKTQFPDLRIYQDWRKMLEKEHNNLDSVNVSTPDHMHAPMGIASLEQGLHVYGQKPLTHDVYESRRLAKIALEKKRVTQMAVSYTHLRAHETRHDLVCRLLLEKNFFNDTATTEIYTLHIVGSVRCV